MPVPAMAGSFHELGRLPNDVLLSVNLPIASFWTHCNLQLCQLNMIIGIIWGCACGARQAASYVMSWGTGVLAVGSWFSAC